jgi:hypothetical protein
MRKLVNRSKTDAAYRVVLKRLARNDGTPAFANGTLFSVGELRSSNYEKAVEKQPYRATGAAALR